MATQSKPPRVVALVIAWNRVDELVVCLDSFGSVDYPNYEILVVDNASQDTTVATVRERFPHVTVIAHDRNLGYVGGSNVGFRYALEHGADYVLLLNQDIKMTPTVLKELVRVMEADARIASAGAKNLLLENPAYTWGKYGIVTWGPLLVKTVGRFELDGPPEPTRDVEWLIGNGCMMSRDALQHVGLFDEEFFHLNEDVEWCTRARRRGYRIVYVDTAAILHKGSSSADVRKAVVFTYGYFLARNAILYARRYASWLQWAKLLAMMTLGFTLRSAWAIVGSIYLGAWGQSPFVTGMTDGFARRLRHERIIIRAHSAGGPPTRRPTLDRFFRWIGA